MKAEVSLNTFSDSFFRFFRPQGASFQIFRIYKSSYPCLCIDGPHLLWDLNNSVCYDLALKVATNLTELVHNISWYTLY